MCAKSGNCGNRGNRAQALPKFPYFREPGTLGADG